MLPYVVVFLHYAAKDGFGDTDGFDDYGAIRLINYLRHRVSEGGSDLPVEVLLLETTQGQHGIWTDERFVVPTMQDDALLFSIVDAGDDGES